MFYKPAVPAQEAPLSAEVVERLTTHLGHRNRRLALGKRKEVRRGLHKGFIPRMCAEYYRPRPGGTTVVGRPKSLSDTLVAASGAGYQTVV